MMNKLLTRLLALAALLLLVTGTAAAQDETYEDPQGRYTVPIPTNWTTEETDAYTLLQSPEGTIRLYFLVQPLDGSPADMIAAAWQQVHPDFSAEVENTLEPPSQPPVESSLVVNYKLGDDSMIYQAVAQTVDDDIYLLLVEGPLVDVQRRAAQIGIIGSGYQITGTQTSDLTGIEPRVVDSEITEALEAYISELMPQFKVPGMVIAIVQHGEIVYANAFGVRRLGESAPMTVDTHMMIGSSGKSLTTTMMATEVDDGLMTWDTPVVEIIPQFTMADPELAQRITVKNLVCACTGVPRRDLEFIINASRLTAEDVVESLSTFEVFTDFGEAFQYSNQMVATGGYVAAAAGGAQWGDLFDGYAALLRDRVLDPVGMPNTTLYFDDVIRRGQYATPHVLHFGFEYAPAELDAEKVLIPVGPAGSHWSTAEDMANYLIMQLNNGVAVDGTRVVSEENLLVTRQPQVAVSANASYGLGWIVGTYKGLPLIEHGGNTMGFTSDLAFLPDAGLGVVILTNAQVTNTFSAAVRTRLIDLVFNDVDAEADAEGIQFALEQFDRQTQPPENLRDRVDLDTVQRYPGTYTNAALGTAVVELEDGKLYVMVGGYRTDVLPVMEANDPNTVDYYITMQPPLTGFALRFVEDDSGAVRLVLGQGVTEYTFTPVE
jgi:CubicO group peptidase (beta-lactamase class C family)